MLWMPVQAKGSWLGEGDDFTFMNMPANGLRALQAGAYGGWGGRQVSKQVVDPLRLSRRRYFAASYGLGAWFPE